MSVALCCDDIHNEELYSGDKMNYVNLQKVALPLLMLLNFVAAIPAANSQQGNLIEPKNTSPRYSEVQPQAQRGNQPDSYGPIVSSDTLWQISKNYRPNSSLSIYQVMQAIYEINLDAFEQQNINLLKNSAILRMPTEDYIFSVNKKQAQQKAQLDIQSFKSNIPNQRSQQVSNTAILEQTKESTEQKIVAIDKTQNSEFVAIQKQFSESIKSLQSILDENTKLFKRLDKVNLKIDALRSEDQISVQMTQVDQSNAELLKKSRQDNAVKTEEIVEKDTPWLDEQITLILLFTLPFLFLLTAFAYWMTKRKGPAVVKPEEDDGDDFSLVPFATRMDNLLVSPSAKLSIQSGNKLDDALGNSIQDSLIDNAENFDDISDDVLDGLLEEDEQQVDAKVDDMVYEEDELLVLDDQALTESVVDEEETQFVIQTPDDLAENIDKFDKKVELSEVINEAQRLIEPEESVKSESLVKTEALTKPDLSDEVEALFNKSIGEVAECDTELKTDLDILSKNEVTLDKNQPNEASENFKKEEFNKALFNLTSKKPASIDDIELDNVFAETIGGLSFDSSQASSDASDDSLGPRDCLVEDEVKPYQRQIDASETDSVDDGIAVELEGSSFDEMLESIDLENDSSLEENNLDFDIAAILSETSERITFDVNEQDIEEFLDVEALLSESFSTKSDDELDRLLDLNISLKPLSNEQDNLEIMDVDVDDGLGTKLDLAHAYIEIGEDDSAKELLDEILQKGSAKQIAEVKIILNKLD